MKQIVTVKPKQRLLLNDIETKIRNARNTNDYFQINFGRSGEFVKIAFCKDQTYCVGYNFWNMEFAIKLNIMIKQYPKAVNAKLAAWVFDWVNRLNK